MSKTNTSTSRGFGATPGVGRGFDGYVEIFRAGKHTDSAGQVKTWTVADLDAMVANHAGEHSAPMVVGHPKADAPAYGWVSELKREGSRLFMRGSQVQPAFEQLVADGRYPNRSVKIVSTANGPKLAHVGFLGAAPPAIEGLQPMQFSAEAEGAVYEFSDSMERYGWSLIADGFRRLRELLIDKFDTATADTVAPQYQIDSLNRIASAPEDDAEGESSPPVAAFSAPAPSAARSPAASSTAAPESTVTTFTQADLDAAHAAGAAAERAKAEAAEAKLAEFARQQKATAATALIATHVAAGRLLPAQTVGLAEFAAALDDAAEFEFAAPDGGAAVKRTPAAAFSAFLESLPVQIKTGGLGGDERLPDGSDPTAIAKRASEFQAAEKAAGREITIAQAVTHVTAGR